MVNLAEIFFIIGDPGHRKNRSKCLLIHNTHPRGNPCNKGRRIARSLSPCLQCDEGIDELGVGGRERFERLLSYHRAGIGIFQIFGRKPITLHAKF